MTGTGIIFGIGYEGRDVTAVIEELVAMKTNIVVDVRLNPLSRKPGLSKRALSDSLEAVGIRYLHRRALGNPRDNRAGFATVDGPGAAGARDRFRDLLATSEGMSAVNELVQLTRDSRVALLCYESIERHCHRREVLEVVRERLG